MVEKRDHLPDFAVRHDLAPGRHGRSAHAASDDVKVLAVGQMGMHFHELRSLRIKRLAVVTLGVVRSAVAIGTLVSVQAGAVEKIGISWLDRVFLFGRMACGRSVQDCTGNLGSVLTGSAADQVRGCASERFGFLT